MPDAPAVAPSVVTPVAAPAGVSPVVKAAEPPPPRMRERIATKSRQYVPTTTPTIAAPPPAASSAPAAAPAAVAPPVATAAQAEPKPAPLVAGEAAVAPPVAEPPLPAVTETEEFRRIARIHRAEAKLAQDRQKFAQERTQLTQRIEHVTKAAQMAQANPLGAIRDVLGLSPQQVLDAILGDAAKTPQQKQEEGMRALAQRQEAIDKQVREHYEAQQRASQDRDVAAHIENKIAPLFRDANSYPHLRHAASITGEDISRAIFAEQQRIHARTKEIRDPKVIADAAEALYAQKAAPLRGSNTAPAQAATPVGTEPPKAKDNGSQVTPASQFSRRSKGRGYRSTLARGQ